MQHFESTHGLVLPNMSAAYVVQRPALISRLLDISSKLSLRDEVVHDSVLLLDRTASQAKQVGRWVFCTEMHSTAQHGPHGRDRVSQDVVPIQVNGAEHSVCRARSGYGCLTPCFAPHVSGVSC